MKDCWNNIHVQQKSEKFIHPQKCCNYPKIQTRWFDHKALYPKDADKMANSVDPDHTDRLPVTTVFWACAQ